MRCLNGIVGGDFSFLGYDAVFIGNYRRFGGAFYFHVQGSRRRLRLIGRNIPEDRKLEQF
jgi:hypothetical protein